MGRNKWKKSKIGSKISIRNSIEQPNKPITGWFQNSNDETITVSTKKITALSKEKPQKISIIQTKV